MYNQLNISIDSIFIQMHIIRQENIFLLIKSEITQVTTSVGTSTNQRNRFLHMGLHHLNPPSLDSKLTSKGNLGKNTKFSKGTKGCRLKYKQAITTMDYSFVALQFLPSMYPRGSLYSTPKGSNMSDLKAYGRPRVRIFGLIWGKLQKYLDLCTHPNVHGFEVKSHVYMWVWV